MIHQEGFKIKKYNERYARKAFMKLLDDAESWKVYNDEKYINKKISKTLWYKNKIVGIYILGKIKDLKEFLLSFQDGEYADGSKCKVVLLNNLRKYKNKTGIVGVGLYIEPEFRGYGAGKMLIEYAESIGDYMCGGHDVKLDNIKHWLKRRKLVSKSYVVKKGRRKLESYFTAT